MKHSDRIETELLCTVLDEAARNIDDYLQSLRLQGAHNICCPVHIQFKASAEY